MGIEAAGRPRRSGPARRLAKALGPLARPIAGSRWFPLWAILHHTGRRSGAAYATPIVARPTTDGYLIPLPFGDQTQWARNLFASGSGRLVIGGRDHSVGEPVIVGLEDARELNVALRALARAVGMRQFVRVLAVPSADADE